MTFLEVLQKIESRADSPAREVSYARFVEAAAHLECEIDPKKVILVAGTNGKGTVAKLLEALYLANGERVGLFTSPHLIKTTERIRLNNKDLEEAEFNEAFQKIESLHDRFQLSHFETLTLMMIQSFFSKQNRIDRAVIEVGVGGLWDPTRWIPHQTTVITKLGFDHQSILGSTLQEIAEHKFGAMTDSNLVVHAKLPEGVVRPDRADTEWKEVSPLPYRVETVTDEPRWILRFGNHDVPLKLQGRRAVENASIALKVLESRNEPINVRALSGASWPGRMERFEVNGRRVYLSGDHNPQGIESLLEILRHYQFRKLYIVFAAGQNKDGNALLRSIKASYPNAILIVTRTPFRATALDGYAEPNKFELPTDALQFALHQATTEDLIVVTGSLYLVGHLRGQLVT